MPERRLLDTTQLFAALPADALDDAAHAGHRAARSSATSCCSTRATRPTSCSSSPTAASRSPPVARRAGVGGRGARGRRPVRRARPVRRRAPRRPTPARSTDSDVLVLAYDAGPRRCSRRSPSCSGSIVRLLARRLRATDEALADAVFLDVPARTAKRLLELAGDGDEFQLPDDPGGARRHGRRLPRAGEQGARAVHPARLDRGRRAAAATSILDRAGARATAPTSDRAVDARSVGRRKREDAPRPRVGRVVGAVGRAVGVVHEAVVGSGVHDDLAVGRGPPTRRAAPRCRRPASTGPGRRRSRASGRRRPRSSSGSRWPGPRQSLRAPGSSRRTATARSKRPVAAALSVYMPPMQNPRIDDVAHVVVHRRGVGRALEVAELRRRRRGPPRAPCAPTASSASRTSPGRGRTARARTPRTRGWRGAGRGRRTAAARP